ncbi:MAG TPA: DUF1194 domain-containing protein [Alphaproteobacteria bacterium]|nr:DUF1194 domain-containing protein [Alphaproteobacteria bacterium]
MSKLACPGCASSAPGSDRSPSRAARLAAALLTLLALAFAAPFISPAGAQEAVDVTLVLAVDVSGSVDMREFALQRQGYAAALTDKRFLNAVQGGEHQAIAVAYFEWTGPGMNAPVYNCTVIRNESDARAMADKIQSTPRLLYGGGTGVGEAIYFAMALHDRCANPTDKRVIDVSGDGRTNRGRRAGPARDEAVQRGMTVNGLAILNEEPDLEQFYRSEVMGGPGSFVAVVNDFETFEDAVIAKMVREISSAPGERQHADAR